MTNKELFKKTCDILKGSTSGGGAMNNIVTASISAFSMVVLIVMIESVIFFGGQLLGLDYDPFSHSYYDGSLFRVILTITRFSAYVLFVSTQTYTVRRSFINLTDGNDGMTNFIQKHMRRVLIPSVKMSIELLLYKILTLSPVSVGIFGIIKYVKLGQTSEIDLFGLVCFMLSIGFTIVWLGLWIHYMISLSLVKYICELNPRANFFDACDLSVKLMEGKHYRVISFYVYYIPIMFPGLLLYPLFALYPIMLESRLLLAKEIMGGYWQDKIPAMAKRWEKQQKRLLS